MRTGTDFGQYEPPLGKYKLINFLLLLFFKKTPKVCKLLSNKQDAHKCDSFIQDISLLSPTALKVSWLDGKPSQLFPAQGHLFLR